MKKWLAGIGATVIGGVLVFWLTVGFKPQTPPPPDPTPHRAMPEIPPTGSGAITVRCSANPHVLNPGDQTELVIQAFSSQNAPVSDANVRIDSGGGIFPSSSSTTVIGRTDYSGSFRTTWRSPSPSAKGYDMRVTVSKQGYVKGHGECRTIIQ